VGTLFKGIFNLSPSATVLEAIVWVAYVVVVGLFFVRAVRHGSRTTRPSPQLVSH